MGALRVSLMCGAAAAAPSGCGPTVQQEAHAVLIAAPLVFALSLVLQLGLLSLWRRVRPSVEVRLVPLGAVFFALLIGAAAALAQRQGEPDLWVLALWLFGCSYGAILLCSTRIALAFDPRRAYVLGHLPALLAEIGAAGLFATGAFNGHGARDIGDAIWIFPGMQGIVTGVIFAALLAEVLLRRRRQRRIALHPTS